MCPMTFNLQSMVDHGLSEHKCHVFFSRPCPYLGQTLLKHVRVVKGHRCDGCGVTPINGVRFKCTTCNDFDLCQDCHRDSSVHSLDHKMTTESCISILYYNQEKRNWNR